MITRLWSAVIAAADPPWQPALAAPAGVAPLRVTVAEALPDLAPDPPCARLTTAWFADRAHLARFDAWSGTGADGSLATEAVVVRGAGWLDRRWADARPRLQHLSLARRHPGLTAAAFSRRWRAHAGRVGATTIPDRVRGQAYVQHHPLPPPAGGGRRWDAVSAVWFDDLADLRARIAWMTATLAAAPPDDLFGERRLVAAREVVLLPG